MKKRKGGGMKPAWLEVRTICKHCGEQIVGYIWPDDTQIWDHKARVLNPLAGGDMYCKFTRAEPSVKETFKEILKGQQGNG